MEHVCGVLEVTKSTITRLVERAENTYADYVEAQKNVIEGYNNILQDCVRFVYCLLVRWPGLLFRLITRR